MWQTGSIWARNQKLFFSIYFSTYELFCATFVNICNSTILSVILCKPLTLNVCLFVFCLGVDEITYYSLQNKLKVCRFVITSPLLQIRKRKPNPPNCLSTSSGYC